MPSTRRKPKNAILALKEACITKPFKSFANLKVGSYYATYFQRESWSHGDKIRVDFYDYYMYLPQRFSRILDDKLLNELNAHDISVVMTYSGKRSDGWQLLDFDIVKYDVDVDVF